MTTGRAVLVIALVLVAAAAIMQFIIFSSKSGGESPPPLPRAGEGELAVRCDALVRAGKFRDAERMLKEGVRARPGSKMLQERLARVHQSMGLFDEALAEFAEALKLAPGDTAIRRDLAFIQNLKGRHADAIRTLESSKYQDFDIVHTLVFVLLDTAAYEPAQAKESLARAEELLNSPTLKDRPDKQGEILANHAKLSWLRGDMAGARGWLEKALAARIGDFALRIDVEMILGWLDLQGGRRETARGFFNAALADTEKWSENNFNQLINLRESILLTLALYFDGKFTKEKVASQFARYDAILGEGFQDKFYNREKRQMYTAWICGDRSRGWIPEIEGLIEGKERRIREENRFPRCFYLVKFHQPFEITLLYNLLGECREKAGERKEAMEAYGKALEITPKDPLASARRAAPGAPR